MGYPSGYGKHGVSDSRVSWSGLMVAGMLLAPMGAWAEGGAEAAASADMSVHLRGVVLPVSQSKMGFSQGGVIVSLVEEGALVKKGDILGKVDDNTAKVEMSKAEATMAAARLGVEQATHNREKTQRLTGEKIVSEMALKEEEFKTRQAENTLRTAEAGLEAAKLALAGCVLKAPFTGVVVTRTAHVGEFVAVGAPVLELADLSRLEMSMDVPPQVVEGLKVGMETTILLEEKPVGKAKARAVLPLVDGVSGLRRVIWVATPDKGVVLSGRYVSLAPWAKSP